MKEYHIPHSKAELQDVLKGKSVAVSTEWVSPIPAKAVEALMDMGYALHVVTPKEYKTALVFVMEGNVKSKDSRVGKGKLKPSGKARKAKV